MKTAEELIKDVVSKHNFPVVAFSGGKDSTAVLNLVRSVKPEWKLKLLMNILRELKM